MQHSSLWAFNVRSSYHKTSFKGDVYHIQSISTIHCVSWHCTRLSTWMWLRPLLAAGSINGADNNNTADRDDGVNLGGNQTVGATLSWLHCPATVGIDTVVRCNHCTNRIQSCRDLQASGIHTQGLNTHVWLDRLPQQKNRGAQVTTHTEQVSLHSLHRMPLLHYIFTLQILTCC